MKIINKKVPKYLEHIESFSIFLGQAKRQSRAAPSKVRF
jgi:hypothetical protein